MLSKNNNNKKAVLATLALILLSLSVASSIAISIPHYAYAQGLFEGLEREQSSESVPGDQPADTGGPAPLNATTTVGGGSNATNATVAGAGNATNATVAGAGNATNATTTATTGDAGTTGSNQTVGGPLALYGGGGGQ
jgi:hypothetical protein